MLTPIELTRYSRHLALPEVGLAGQERLKAARVVIVGAGGLGSPAALYLAAAGVGTLAIVDFDQVELANLHRQILHGSRQVGRAKVASAADRLADLNPDITIEAIDARLTPSLAAELFSRFDWLLDGTDNFPARYAVNDAAVLAGKPYVYGSISRFEGQVSVFGASGGPCYRCLFPEPPPPGLVPSCAEAGVLGVLPGVIGTLQAVEVIKLILGIGEPLVSRLLSYHALSATFREWRIDRAEACPSCGSGHPRPPAEAVLACASTPEIAPADLGRLAGPQLVDVRERWEWDIAHLAGSIHIPIGALPGALGSLDPARPVVAICHKGARSLVASQILNAAGFRAVSLAGGIDRWSREVDSTLARY